MLATPLHFGAEKHCQIFIFLMENFKFSSTADITKCLITITLFFFSITITLFKYRAPPYKSGSKKCLLCLKEKTAIALCDPKTLLNTKSELLKKCIHHINVELRKHR